MPDGDDSFIYQFRIHLVGISPLIWRRLLIPSDWTIADFHYLLQIAFDWENIHLHRFSIHARDYGISYIGGMSFWDDPNEIRLGDFDFRKNEKFLYQYDFGDDWRHLIRVEDILPLDSRRNYPVCTGGSRHAPPEECGGVEAFDEIQCHLPFRLTEMMEDFLERWLELVEKGDGKIADVQTEIEDLRDRADHIQQIQRLVFPPKFSRRRINRALLKYSLDRGKMPEPEAEEDDSR